MRIQAAREGRQLDVRGAVAELTRYDAVISGRIAVGLVDRASIYAARESRRDLNQQDIRDALDDLMVSISSADERQALLAIAHTTWKPHLPWLAARALGMSEQMPAFVGQLLNAMGELDVELLQHRMDALRSFATTDDHGTQRSPRR